MPIGMMLHIERFKGHAALAIVPLGIDLADRRPSGLAHAIFDVEPAVIAGQSLRLHLFAAGRELALVGAPLGSHVLQLLSGQFHFRGLGGWSRRGRRSWS